MPPYLTITLSSALNLEVNQGFRPNNTIAKDQSSGHTSRAVEVLERGEELDVLELGSQSDGATVTKIAVEFCAVRSRTSDEIRAIDLDTTKQRPDLSSDERALIHTSVIGPELIFKGQIG